MSRHRGAHSVCNFLSAELAIRIGVEEVEGLVGLVQAPVLGHHRVHLGRRIRRHHRQAGGEHKGRQHVHRRVVHLRRALAATCTWRSALAAVSEVDSALKTHRVHLVPTHPLLIPCTSRSHPWPQITSLASVGSTPRRLLASDPTMPRPLYSAHTRAPATPTHTLTCHACSHVHLPRSVAILARSVLQGEVAPARRRPALHVTSRDPLEIPQSGMRGEGRRRGGAASLVRLVVRA